KFFRTKKRIVSGVEKLEIMRFLVGRLLQFLQELFFDKTFYLIKTPKNSIKNHFLFYTVIEIFLVLALELFP
ncbi:hypothetical protein ACE1R5_09615, partial [Streptococcus pneumoniae]